MWCTPDEYCTAKLELSIGETEKRIFWEMTRIIIELPEITNHVSNGIKDREDLTEMLVKTESRVLWTKDGPPHIPKEMATTFILQAYVNDHGQKYY